MNQITFPTIITLVRLIVSPIVVPLLIVYGLPLGWPAVNMGIAGIFIVLSLTDFFDGFCARRYGLVSSIGASLDPLADKFLVYSTLIALLAVERIYFYWVVVLIGRDFFMMGLRQIALESGFEVRVSWLGKIKTAVLLTYLAVAIGNPYYGEWRNYIVLNSVQELLLIATMVLSVWSAKKYYDVFIALLKNTPKNM